MFLVQIIFLVFFRNVVYTGPRPVRRCLFRPSSQISGEAKANLEIRQQPANRTPRQTRCHHRRVERDRSLRGLRSRQTRCERFHHREVERKAGRGEERNFETFGFHGTEDRRLQPRHHDSRHFVARVRVERSGRDSRSDLHARQLRRTLHSLQAGNLDP